MSSGLAALRVPAYRRLWLGALMSSVGSMMYLTALGWLTATTTGSPLKVTILSFSGLLPLLALSPLAGALADRHSRKQLLLVTLLLQFAVAVGLAAVVTADLAPYWVLLLFAIGGGATGALTAPVFSAVLPTLVPPEALRNAVVLNSMQYNISRALGPMAAGLLLDAVGPAVVFWCNAASFLGVLAGTLWLPALPVHVRRHQRSVAADLGAAIRYVRATPGLRVALGTAGLLALISGPIQWLAPIIATEGLDLDARRFGLFLGSYGIGAMVAGVGLLFFDRGVPYRYLATGGTAGVALALVGLGLAPGFVMGVVAMGALGTAFLVASTTFSSSLQAQLDDRVRGRVMSLWMMIFGGVAPLGILIQGSLSEVVNVQWVLLGDGVVLAAVLVWFAVRRRFRVLDEPTRTAGPSAEAAPARSERIGA